jgi:glucose/arabinose dehydrogenase
MACLTSAVCSHAAITGVQRLAVGHMLNFPAFATHAPSDRERLFVTELGGNIKIIDLNNPTAAPIQFLNIADTKVAGEGGLLGLAFHPNYFGQRGPTGRGKFYVYVTVDNGGINIGGAASPFSSHIREYSVMGDPTTSNVADPMSKREILQIVRPQSNHNAGWIGFNPALAPGQPQYLYIASGDGGGSNDEGAGHTPGTGNAQDTTNNLLGKMLRIDINGDDFPADANRNYAIPATNPFKAGVGTTTDDAGDDEIWAYGLRNPYRNSFDRQTGDLWMGDVGQGQREEVDFLPASSGGAQNYGWRLREGNIQTPTVGGPPPANHVPPIYDYTRGSGALQGETVIAGYRYRGPDPELQGRYFFADASDDNVWEMLPPQPVAPNTVVTNIDSSLNNLSGVDRIVSFGEDAIGRLYLVDMATGPNNAPNANSGEIYRILTTPMPGDFNFDNIVNDLDIDLLAWAAQNDPNNPLYDLNGDGDAEFTVSSSGMVSDSDRLIRQHMDVFDISGSKIGNGTEYGDLNLDGRVSLIDLDKLVSNYRDAGQFGWSDGNINGSVQAGTSANPQITLIDLDTLVMQYGFVKGSGAALAAVPEPTGWMLTLWPVFATICANSRALPMPHW